VGTIASFCYKGSSLFSYRLFLFHFLTLNLNLMFCWAVWITWFASSSRSMYCLCPLHGVFEKVKREQIKWKMIIFFIFFGVLLTVSVFQISFQSLIKWKILVAQNSNPQSTFFELNCLVKRWTKETKMLLVCREASVSGTAN
jgi:hypothetical protein